MDRALTTIAQPFKSCVVIGAGNVATHLAAELARAGVDILQIYSRNIASAESLAQSLNAEAVDDLQRLNQHADLYVVSVPDDAIPAVLEQTRAIDSGVWVHTSGSSPIDLFEGKKSRFGVFYPLQTFSKTKQVDFSVIPLLLEANSQEVTNKLESLAQLISRKVEFVDSNQRRSLHVAAVFACNFVNYLWGEAAEVLADANLDFSLLMPLLEETLGKLNTLSPRDAQTGPARRGDMSTINRHLAMLKPEQAKVYKLLSNNILNKYNSGC